MCEFCFSEPLREFEEAGGDALEYARSRLTTPEHRDLVASVDAVVSYGSHYGPAHVQVEDGNYDMKIAGWEKWASESWPVGDPRMVELERCWDSASVFDRALACAEVIGYGAEFFEEARA